MKKHLILLVFALVQFSANAQKSNKQFNFLLGNWEMKTAKGKITESWVNKKDSLLGKSYKHNLKGDSSLMETVVIKKTEGNFYFCVTGAQDDKSKMVRFKLVSSKKNILIFENKAHDFPQRVVYENKGKNELYAWIWGIMNGKESKIEYSYLRKK